MALKVSEGRCRLSADTVPSLRKKSGSALLRATFGLEGVSLTSGLMVRVLMRFMEKDCTPLDSDKRDVCMMCSWNGFNFYCRKFSEIVSRQPWRKKAFLPARSSGQP